MVFTHSYRIEENQQWVTIGGGSMSSFDSSGKFCAKFVKTHIELWETRNFHLPMTVLSYPDAFSTKSDIMCYGLVWSNDSQKLVGVLGSRLGNRKVVQRDIFLVVWNVRDLSVDCSYRIPFVVTSIGVLPLQRNRYVILGTLEVDCHLLLDTSSGSVREVMFGNEHDSDLFHLPHNDVPIITCTLTNSLVGPTTNSDVTIERSPDKAEELWSARLDYQESPLDWKRSTSALVVSHVTTTSSDCAVTMYVVCNSYGCAEKLQKITIVWDEAAADLKLKVASSVNLTGFSERVSSAVLNADCSRLLLLASNCSAIQLFSVTTSEVYFVATLLKGGDVLRTVQGEVLPAVTNSCIGGGFVMSAWKKANVRMSKIGKPPQTSAVEESVLLGVVTAGSVYVSRLIVCRLPSSTAPTASSGEGSDTPMIECKSINAPRSGLVELFIRPTPPAPASTAGIASGTTVLTSCRASAAVVGVDPVGRCLLLHWSCRQSDFPGPMYPIGYNLIQECSTYLEGEEELDKVMVTSTAPAATAAAAAAAIEDNESDEPQIKKSRIMIDIGGVFDTRKKSPVSSSGGMCDNVLQRLSFSVDQHYMPVEERRVFRSDRKKPSAHVAVTSGEAGDVIVSGMAMEVETDGGEGDEGGTSSAFDFLSDALGIPHKITTGDYFAKQKRDRDQGAATLALCNDKVHVSRVLRLMRKDAVERAEAQEEAKERQRIKNKERAEEKRIQMEAAKRAKLMQERLERQERESAAAASFAAALATKNAHVASSGGVSQTAGGTSAEVATVGGVKTDSIACIGEVENVNAGSAESTETPPAAPKAAKSEEECVVAGEEVSEVQASDLSVV